MISGGELEDNESEIECCKRELGEQEIIHTPEEYDFPDSLYQDHWAEAEAFGVVDANGKLLACIEFCPESWSNRLMVTELWVDDSIQKMGFDKCFYRNNDIQRHEI